MTEIFFNVSLNGKHVFRTDKYTNKDQVVKIEAALKLLIAQGYDVTRYESPVQSWNTTEVK